MEPTLFFTSGENEKLLDKAVFFSKFLPDGQKRRVNLAEANDGEVLFGEISKNCLLQLNNVMELTYQPMIERLEDKKYWGECDPEYIEEF